MGDHLTFFLLTNPINLSKFSLNKSAGDLKKLLWGQFTRLNLKIKFLLSFVAGINMTKASGSLPGAGLVSPPICFTEYQTGKQFEREESEARNTALYRIKVPGHRS